MPKRTLILLFAIIYFVLISICVSSSPTFIENTTWEQNITTLTRSTAIWGDIENDGDMDLVLSGCTSLLCNNSNSDRVYVYTNNLSSLTENIAVLYNFSGIANDTNPLAWGDFDNNGYLDLLIVSNNGSKASSKIYLNNGNTLVENQTWGQNLTAFNLGSLSIGDLNNDGWLDLVMFGLSLPNFARQSKVYINNKSSLVENRSWAIQNSYGALDLGDIDADGDLDLITSGSDNAVYINNGTGFSQSTEWAQNLSSIGSYLMHLLDIDNDGRLDLVKGTSIYINNQSAFVDNVSWSQNFSGISLYNLAWGDIDNNGYSDLVTNIRRGNNLELAIFTNNGSAFVFNESWGWNLTFTNLSTDSIALADIDNDTDLDLIISGYYFQNGPSFTKIYTNNLSAYNITNRNPSAPINFTAVNCNAISLRWEDGNDTETSAKGLYYNLRIGTSSGGNNILSGIYGGRSKPETGYFGNMIQRQSISLVPTDFNINRTYYWGVQAIDSSLKPSAWSIEQIFETFFPQISLNYPSDSYSTSSHSITFNITVSDFSLFNVSIQGDFNSPFEINQTNSSGTNGTYLFSLNLSETRAFTWGIKACDRFMNCISSGNRTLTVTSDSTPPSTSSGGGGSGGSTTATAVTKISRVTMIGEGLNKIDFTETEKASVGIEEILIESSARADYAKVSVEKLAALPENIPFTPSPNTYTYLKIEKTVLKDEDFKNAKMIFSVSKRWISENNYNPKKVVLHRYTSGWNKLPTQYLRQNGTYYYYESTTPGFSVFAVTAEKKEEQPVPAQQANITEQKEEKGSPSAEEVPQEPLKQKSTAWKNIIFAIIAAAFIVGVLILRKKRKITNK